MQNQYNLLEMLMLYRQFTGLHICLIDRDLNIRKIGIMNDDDLRMQEFFASRNVSTNELTKAQYDSIRNNVECVYTNVFGFSYIIYSPNLNNAPPGSIQAGPFWMEKDHQDRLMKACRQYHISPEELHEALPFTDTLPTLNQDELNSRGRLLFYMFSCLNYDAGAIIENLAQRAQIMSVIQRFNQEPVIPPYPYELERTLHMMIKTRNMDGAKKILYELEGYETSLRGKDFPKLQMRFLHLCSLMSRAAMAGGADDSAVCDLADQFMLQISRSNTIPEISSHLRTSLDAYFNFMFTDKTTSNFETIRKAISYINNNYDSPITLKDIAGYLHLNPAYFSSLFHQQTGKTFSEHLRQVRIEQAKVLLTTTEHSIISIAVSVGFEDQAYFTKIFREYTGMTPTEYRQSFH